MRHVRILSRFPKDILKLHNVKQCSTYETVPSYYHILRHFPNVIELLAEEQRILVQYENFKKGLVGELIEECGMKMPPYSSLFFKRLVLTATFDSLKGLHIKANKEEIVDSLAQFLEPFPLNKEKIIKTKEKFNTVVSIRQELEVQYLAWKFKTNYEHVADGFKNLRECLFYGRSFRNYQRNLKLLTIASKKIGPRVWDKIYFLNLMPLSQECLKDISVKIAGENWYYTLLNSPCFLKKPYPLRCLYVDILKSKGFRLKQISECLPFTNTKLQFFLEKLNFLLSYPIAEHKANPNFLRLMYFSTTELKYLIECAGKTYDNLILLNRLESKKKPSRIHSTTIQRCLNKFFEVKYKEVQKLKYHPEYSKCTLLSVEETVRNLLSRRFSADEIRESLPITLYQWSSVSRAIRKMKSEEENLKSYGFCNGWVKENTDIFSSGTKLKRKSLQICLFYLHNQYYVKLD